MSSDYRSPVARKTPYLADSIRLPEKQGLDQDQEWCEVKLDGQWQRFRFHDYNEIYQVPGLYESLFYRTLKCCSPQRVVGLLDELLDEHEISAETLRVLDVGAGNGMVGQELRGIGVKHVTGVDIVPEAKTATERDRPGVYHDYLITDLTDLPEDQEKQLRKQKLNCLTTVAALGFGDIPPAAFLTSLRVLETPGWLAFNIKEDFLVDQESKFCKLIRDLEADGVIRFEAYRRYCHRLAITGEPLHYIAMIASKQCDVPDSYIESDA